jgi:circadian clock protein KaiB
VKQQRLSSEKKRNEPAMKVATRKKGQKAHKTGSEVWNLRLYIAGNSARSMIALTNLQKICDEHPGHKYHVEVIDLLKNPRLAAGDQIIAVPTLVRRLPPPPQKNDRGFVERRECGGWARSALRRNFVMKAQSLKSAIRANASRKLKYVLRLYITGATSRSRRAILNINAICQQDLQGRFDLEHRHSAESGLGQG